jgi:hypothetical protein
MFKQTMAGIAVVGMLGACASMMKDRPLTVNMAAQSGSGQSGSATLTPQGGSTQVALNIKPGPTGVAQPAHVHEGSCAKLNPAPKYGLANVTNGTSSTTVPAPLETLQATPHAINVHASAENVKTYVSCGDIKR